MARSISLSEASTLSSGSEATQVGSLSGRAAQILLSSSLATRARSGYLWGRRRLDRRVGEGQHLLMAWPLVCHARACLDVVEHRDAGYAFHHVALAGCQLANAIGDGARHHMIVDIDLALAHHRPPIAR